MGIESTSGADRRAAAASSSPPSSAAATIADFFESRSVFVTGGTGFLGKVLIEKLLRSCPGVGKIYVLVRPKRRQDAEQRLRDLLDSQVFDHLRRADPTALAKVVGVAGNLVEHGLGLSDEDEATLIREVSVVFHSAATVNFEEPLKNAVAMNLQGTLSIIQLCWRLTNIAAFVHLSTAFSNCDKSETYERIYPTQQDPEKVMNAASWLSQNMMDEIFQTTKGNKPNTYIYTKALAESLVESRAAGLPTCIVRPAIVGPTAQEPFPGWIDSPNGPIGLTLATGNGVLQSVFCDPGKRADVVPADYVINLMIAAAWKAASIRDTTRGPRDTVIYNYSSSVENPITWGQMMDAVMDISRVKYPFETTVLYPSLAMTTSHLAHRLNTTVFQILPALVLDALARWTGRPARLMKIQRKLLRTQEALAYFCTQDWDFRSKNVPMLWDELGEADKKTFNFDIAGLRWVRYLEAGILGCRTYYLRQDPSSIPACREKLARLRQLGVVAKISSTIFLLFFVLRLLGRLAPAFRSRLMSLLFFHGVKRSSMAMMPTSKAL